MSTPAPPSRVPALVALALAMAGATISIVLLRSHLIVLDGDTAGGLFCGGGGRFDCDTVAAHPSSFALGLPLPVWGIVFYAAVAALALMAWRLPGDEAGSAASMGTVLSLAAIMLDAWLGYVMVARIGAICLNCVSTYLVNLALAAAFWRLDMRLSPVRHWPTLLARWKQPRPGRWLKVGAVCVAIAGMVTALTLTRGAVAVSLLDAQDEANTLLNRIETETPIDMTPFAHLPAQGPPDAKVQIVVASDFQCSFCRALAARLDEVRALYPNDVRIAFLNAPIDPKCNPKVTYEGHAHACWLARAGACAALQGRFWQYHDLVYRDLPPARATEVGVRSAIARAGIDPAELDRCLAGAEADSAVARDVRAWITLEMNSVPSIIINGHMKSGGLYPTALKSLVQALVGRPAP